MKKTVAKKSVVALGLSVALTTSLIPSQSFAAVDLGKGKYYEEVENNNSKEKAQKLELLPFSTKTPDSRVSTFVEGDFSSNSDEDWYKVTMKELGELSLDFYDENGKALSGSKKPFVEIYATRYDGSFGLISEYQDGLPAFMKGLMYDFTNHKINNEVYIRLKPITTNPNYVMKVTYGENPASEGLHEPNNIFSSEWNHYETANIEPGKWITSNFTNMFDQYDNFSIKGQGNSGTLTYSVKYSDEEFKYWNDNNVDYYITYNLLAEKKDGTFETIGNKAVIGMPNQTFTQKVEVDNSNFTGKYVVQLANNTIVNHNYQLNIDFQSNNEPVPEDTVAPGNVSNLQVKDKSQSSISFLYELPTDKDFKEVIVLRDGKEVATTTSETFEDTKLLPNKSYTYTFISVDENGNKSKGSTISAKTDEKPQDLEAPGEVSNLKLKNKTKSSLSFSFSLPSDKDFKEVIILRNGKEIGATKTNDFEDTNLSPNSIYTYKFISVDETGNKSSGSTIEATTEKEVITKPEEKVSIERISGETRFETSLAFTKKIETGSLDSVIVADGLNFPDALTGAVLNSSQNGAVLLVHDRQDILDSAVKEADRLLKDGGQVIILGGKAAVSQEIEKSFDKNLKVTRLGGDTRFDTAINIAEKVNPNPEQIFVVNGMDFADSLSIVPYASKMKNPILLTSNKNGLENEVRDYIKKHPSIKKVTIVGGNGVVSNEIKNSLSKYASVERVSGEDRFATSLEIAKKYYSKSTKVGISNAFSFADSLSGSQFAYMQDMPILLTRQDKLEKEVSEHLANTKDIFLFGGEAVISNDINQSLE